jgi:hypothetical protein
VRLVDRAQPVHARGDGASDRLFQPRRSLARPLGRECVEHGYLLIPAMLRAEVSGDSTNREAMDGFAQVAAGVAEFFSDENAGRIFAAAA